MDGAGIALEGLRTRWGTLGYRLRRDAGRIILDVPPGSAMPPGGLVLPWPLAQPLRCARVTGAQPDLARGEIRIAKAPARVVAGIDAACR